MKIKYKEYLMEQTIAHRFDLRKGIVVNKKDGTTEDSTVILGYDMRLTSCVDTIIKNELMKDESVCSLKEFIAAYKDMKEDITKTVCEL